MDAGSGPGPHSSHIHAGMPTPEDDVGGAPDLHGSSFAPIQWISDGVSLSLMFVQTYGWLLVAIGLICYFVWTRIRDRFYEMYEKSVERRELARTDPTTVVARQEAMAAARERMQREADEKSRRYAEKQKEDEERKRAERVEDWDRHQRGEGYRSRVKKPAQSDAAAASQSNPKKKRTLRDSDYNPLMGHGGGGGGFQRASGRHTFRSGGGG